MIGGSDSIQNAPVDPLLGVDVIYNAGQNYPAAGYTSRPRPTSARRPVGTTATITTTAATTSRSGATVTIAGVAEAGYNGTFTVTAIRRQPASATPRRAPTCRPPAAVPWARRPARG